MNYTNKIKNIYPNYQGKPLTSLYDSVSTHCKRHGNVELKVHEILDGIKCRKCALLNKNRKPTNEIIERCKQVHGNKYDYSEFEYFGMHKRSVIHCPKHGKFLQRVNDHINSKAGCPDCGGKRPHRTKSLESLLAHLHNIHNRKYSYNFDRIPKTNDHIEVQCPSHGPFFPTLNNHMHLLSGCPKCSNERTPLTSIDDQSLCTFYWVHCNSFYKIGITRRSVATRLAKMSHTILYQKKMTGHDAFCLEQFVLSKLDEFRIKEPKIKFPGWTECFDITKDSTQLIINSIATAPTLTDTVVVSYSNASAYSFITNLRKSDSKTKFVFLHELSSFPASTQNQLVDTNCFKCKMVNFDVAEQYYKKQGKAFDASGSINVGLFFKEDPVAMMSFGTGRSNNDHWKLRHSCFATEVDIQNGSERILSYFIEKMHPSKITCYCESRLLNGNVYEKLGFDLVSASVGHFYVKTSGTKIETVSRVHCTRQKLIQRYGEAFCDNLSQREIMKKLGYEKVYCGEVQRFERSFTDRSLFSK